MGGYEMKKKLSKKIKYVYNYKEMLEDMNDT